MNMFWKTMPYTVTVTKKRGTEGEDVHITVNPQPICTKDEFIPVVQKSIERTLFENFAGKPNDARTRALMRKEIEDKLSNYHSQQMIRPFDPKIDEAKS
jgi:hypothetical protein